MESSGPKVLPVKDPPQEVMKPLHPNLPQPPALLLMISPIRTGKSTIISNLLLNSNFYGQDYFDDTIVISPTIYNDKTSRFLKKSCSCYDEYSDDKYNSSSLSLSSEPHHSIFNNISHF